MSNIACLFLPLAFSSLPAVLPFVSPSSQVLMALMGLGMPRGWIDFCQVANGLDPSHGHAMRPPVYG